MKKVADVLHKTAVTGLIGLTIVGAATFAMQISSFLSMTRARKAALKQKTESTVLDISNDMASFSSFGLKLQNFLRSAKCFVNLQHFSSASKQRTWKVLRANHVAVATGNLEKSVNFYQDILGIKTSQSVPLPEHGVTTVFVELANIKLELLLPLGEKSPIENYLQKNPSGGMHHICLEVDNIQNAVKDLKENNVRMLSDEPKVGAHGKPVIFLHPKDCGGILIELEEV